MKKNLFFFCSMLLLGVCVSTATAHDEWMNKVERLFGPVPPPPPSPRVISIAEATPYTAVTVPKVFLGKMGVKPKPAPPAPVVKQLRMTSYQQGFQPKQMQEVALRRAAPVTTMTTSTMPAGTVQTEVAPEKSRPLLSLLKRKETTEIVQSAPAAPIPAVPAQPAGPVQYYYVNVQMTPSGPVIMPPNHTYRYIQLLPGAQGHLKGCLAGCFAGCGERLSDWKPGECVSNTARDWRSRWLLHRADLAEKYDRAPLYQPGPYPQPIRYPYGCFTTTPSARPSCSSSTHNIKYHWDLSH